MGSFRGQPIEYNRFLGLIDQDDQTNAPVGLAWVARNVEFSLTSVRTRSGISKTIQGVNKSPLTGLLDLNYSPETADQSFFQAPILFDMIGQVQAEYPCGSGDCTPLSPATGPNRVMNPQPAASHMLATEAYNRAFMAYSNLIISTALMGVLNPSQAADFAPGTAIPVEPYGLKPYGWPWVKNSQVFVGEVCTPSVPGGNGHTYVCIQAGVTGADQPVWPTGWGVILDDGSAVWQEKTVVAANRLPVPAAPLIALAAGGALGSGKDVYVVVAYENAAGTTTISPASMVTTDAGHQSVTVQIPAIASLAEQWMFLTPSPPTALLVYAAIVTTGSLPPAQIAYQVADTVPVASWGAPITISAAPSGATPSPRNGARITPGGFMPNPTMAPAVGIWAGSGSGTFPAGAAVYVGYALFSSTGVGGAPFNVTEMSPAGMVVVPAGKTVSVTLPDPGDVLTGELTSPGIALYTAVAAVGDPAPTTSQFAYAVSYENAPGIEVQITGGPGTGPPPATVNNTGVGNIAKDQPPTDVNSGFRYLNLSFVSHKGTFSGFNENASIPVDIDYDGWQLWLGNIPTPPANCNYVQAVSSEADGTPAGPFFGIGNIGVNPWVYPTTVVSFGTPMTSMLLTAGTPSATFNFTDSYLIAAQDYTDRLSCIWPQACIDIYYSESTDRLVQTGVPGYYSGHWFSLSNGDPESYYGADRSFLKIGTNDGQRAWCLREFAGAMISFRERSGYTVTPDTEDPASWKVKVRWKKVGPCGPRAVDVATDFLIFVHRSGVYRYSLDMAKPELVSKEVPRLWATINWTAAQVIWVAIDEETHTVHIGVPIGNSTVPNQEIVINYLEGWQNPIHFSVYASKEISMDAARRYSINDIAAYVGKRIERIIPNPPPFDVGGVEGLVQPLDSSYYISQFAYASSGADGAVHAMTPGVYRDNDSGIKSIYETVCGRAGMSVSKSEGINLNAKGNGNLENYLIPGRRMFEDPGQGDVTEGILTGQPYALEPNQNQGISIKYPTESPNEMWRIRFATDGQPDSWFDLKYSQLFVIPTYGSREPGESNRGSVR